MERTDASLAPESAREESLEAYFGSLGRRPPMKARKTEQRSAGRRLLSLFLTFLLTILFVLLIRQYALQHNTVVGTSMMPTLEDKDEIFVEKISKLFPQGLKRGAIVTANTHRGKASGEKEYIIKRIIGLPGERVTIRDGLVLIDGYRLVEPYLEDGVRTDGRLAEYLDLVLAEDEFYLMGDNRSNSRDSRDTGPFLREDIVGCLLLRFYPFNRIGKPG